MARETTIITSLIEKKFPTVNVQQYDSGRELVFFLLDKIGAEEVPIDLTDNFILLIVEPPSKNKVPILGEVVDGPNGECRVRLTKMATAENGLNKAQLLLTGSNGTIKSKLFDIDVDRALDPGDIITASAEFTELEMLVMQLNGELAELSTLNSVAAAIINAYEAYTDAGGEDSMEDWLLTFTLGRKRFDDRAAWAAAVLNGDVSDGDICFWGV